MNLTPQQRAFFETFGYLGFPGRFAEDAEAISAEFERLWADRMVAGITGRRTIMSSVRRWSPLSTRAST